MAWWQYLLLVNLYLVLFYGFYALLLRTETFFHLNRIYLVTSSLLSFFIPLIHSDWVSRLFITQRVQQTLSVYARPITIYQHLPIQAHHFTIGSIIVLVYAAGAAILALRLISQLISLRKIINEPEPSSAFSFFKNIRLGANLVNQDIIEAHEHVHATQWHSADIILIETIAIINWFNPIVYFYRRGIKHIHEFIADRQALKNGTTKSEYALLLLSQTLKAPTHQLVTPFFNHSLLKRRIIMLQKSQSRYMALLKYGLSAPLFMMMLVLSSAAVIKSYPVKLFNNKAENVFLTPIIIADPPKATRKDEVRVNELAVSEDAVAKQDSATEIPETVIPARGKNLEIRSETADRLHTEPIIVSIEQAPQFKGGMLGFYQFLARNLHYPDQMFRYNVQGSVIISLTVEKDGSLTDIKSVKDVGYGSADEVIRVLKKSPKWQPGFQNGRPVRITYTLPISFNLDKEDDVGDTISKVTYTYKIEEPEPVQSQPVHHDVAVKDTSSGKYNMILGDDFDFGTNAIYLLDGKVIPDLDHIDFTTVGSIKVVKHPSKSSAYVTKYGEKALNGVVIIESRK
jgi:TonB family protein